MKAQRECVCLCVCVCVCGSLTSRPVRPLAAADLKYVLCYSELFSGEPQNTESGAMRGSLTSACKTSQ